METIARRLTTGLLAALGVGVVMAAAGLALVALCTGCTGLGSGHKAPQMYTFNIAKDAKSTIVVGSAGTQTYMPQTMETPEAVDTATVSAGTTADATATGATQAAVSKGKMAMAIAGADNNKRTAENDVSAALQALQGNTQTQAGQTPTSAQHQGTASGTATGTQTPTSTATTTVAPNTPLSYGGNAAVTSPAANTAGPASTGTANAGASTANALPAATPPVTPAPAPAAEWELAKIVTANPDGTVTATVASGSKRTGTAVAAPPIDGFVRALLIAKDGAVWKVQADDGTEAAKTLCPGCVVTP